MVTSQYLQVHFLRETQNSDMSKEDRVEIQKAKREGSMLRQESNLFFLEVEWSGALFHVQIEREVGVSNA
jgi:hypothetical protein